MKISLNKKTITIAVVATLAVATGSGLFISGLLDGLKERIIPKQEEPASQPAQAPAPKPEVLVKIGHAGPINGHQAALGKESESGVLLAIEDLNSQEIEIGDAKIKFSLVSEDDQANEEWSAKAANKLAAEKVSGVVGHLHSAATISASKVYSDSGIPQISVASSNPRFTEQGFKTAFRIVASDSQQSVALAGFAASQKAKRIAIIDDSTEYGHGMAKAFKEASVIESSGAKVVFHEQVQDQSRDFSAVLKKMKAAKPDFVFFGGMDYQAGWLAKQLKLQGFKATLLAGEGSCSKTMATIAGKAGDGQFCGVAGESIDNLSKAQEFKDKFAARFGYQPTKFAYYAYDATMLMVDAMKRANSVEPASYINEISKGTYEGITGKISFDDKGNLKNAPVSIYKLDQSALVYYESVTSDEDVMAKAENVTPETSSQETTPTPTSAQLLPVEENSKTNESVPSVQVDGGKSVEFQGAKK